MEEVLAVVYNQSKKKSFIIVGIVLVIVLIGLLVYRSRQFRMADVNPSLNKVAYISPFLEVSFTQKLNSKGLNVAASNNIVKTYEVKDKKIIIQLQNMKKNTSYSVTLTGITAQDGRVIPLETLSFTAKDSDGILPKDQQKYAVQKQDEDKPKSITDPILAALPHSTLNYHLSALVGDKLTLKARITPSKADLNSDKASVPQSFVDATKKDIDTYIRSLKLDPAKYTIEYEVVIPSVF